MTAALEGSGVYGQEMVPQCKICSISAMSAHNPVDLLYILGPLYSDAHIRAVTRDFSLSGLQESWVINPMLQCNPSLASDEPPVPASPAAPGAANVPAVYSQYENVLMLNSSGRSRPAPPLQKLRPT